MRSKMSAVGLATALGLALAGCSSTAATDAGGDVRRSELVRDSSQSAAYSEDALNLAIRQLRRDRAAEDQQVEVPADLVTSLYNALAAVYASSSPARDTVVTALHIHTYPTARELLVGADESVAWAHDWVRGQQPPANGAAVALLSTYRLTVSRSSLSSPPFAMLRPERVINVVPVAAAFERIAGIRYAEPNGFGGDGSDITAYRTANGWKLDYSFGSGDCLAGCINRSYWTFEVSNDGHAEFVGARIDHTRPPRE